MAGAQPALIDIAQEIEEYSRTGTAKCQQCVEAGLAPSEAIACYAHSKLELQLQRERVAMLLRERQGEVWIWQGDEEDKVESLTCPILIQPADLMPLLRASTHLVAILSGQRECGHWSGYASINASGAIICLLCDVEGHGASVQLSAEMGHLRADLSAERTRLERARRKLRRIIEVCNRWRNKAEAAERDRNEALQNSDLERALASQRKSRAYRDRLEEVELIVSTEDLA